MKLTITTTPQPVDTTADRPYSAYNNGAADIWYALQEDPVAEGQPLKPGERVVLGGRTDYSFATESGTSELRVIVVPR